MIKVPITSYVYKYLLFEHGPGPYDITQSSINKLRFEFLTVHVYAANYTSLYTHENALLQIDASPSLKKYYTENSKYFERGIFCANMFFHAFENQISVMHDLMNLSYEDSIERFKEKYDITERDYSFDNMWRQYCRIQKRNRIYQGNRKIEKPVGSRAIRLKPSPNFFLKPKRSTRGFSITYHEQ